MKIEIKITDLETTDKKLDIPVVRHSYSMENTGVKIKNNIGKYEQFQCENEGFVLATFDPNAINIYKLEKIEGIKKISKMKNKDGINIKLERNLDLVGIRRSKGKIMEYEIVVKLNYA